MWGSDAMQESLFTVAQLEGFVPADHPFRLIRSLVNINKALERLNGLFSTIYADTGRASPSPVRNCCAPCSSR